MKRKLFVTLWTCLLASCTTAPAYSQSEAWTSETKALYVTSAALLMIDWAQTRDIATRTDGNGYKVYKETNPLLPAYPTLGQVNKHFIGALIGQYVMMQVLPADYRNYFLTGLVVVQLGYVGHNKAHGVKLNIGF